MMMEPPYMKYFPVGQVAIIISEWEHPAAHRIVGSIYGVKLIGMLLGIGGGVK